MRNGNEERVLMPHIFYWPDAPVVATGRYHPVSDRFQRGPNPLESRPDASGGPWPDAGRVRSTLLHLLHTTGRLTSSDRTLKRRVRSLLRSKFTSCELIGRGTLESGAASSHSFPANLQESFMLPVPNQVPTRIRSKWTPIGTDVSDLSQTLIFFKIFCFRL